MVTRRDLPSSYQAVQSAHAAIDFIFEHPGRASPWHTNSKYLVFLALQNEAEILKLEKDCKMYGLAYSLFREPDIGDQVTAIAIEPSKLTQKLVKRIPLM